MFHRLVIASANSQSRMEIRSGLALLQARSPYPRYYVLELRGKPVQQGSANSKVVHQQNETISVVNTCSHASIFRCLKDGRGGGWVSGGWACAFLTSGSCRWAGGFQPGIYQDTYRCLRCRIKVFGVIWA